MAKYKSLIYLIFFLSFLGFLDAGFLTYEHFQNTLPPCSLHFQLVDCDAVLRSSYATILGIPVAFFGVIDYFLLLSWIFLYTVKNQRFFLKILALQATFGLVASLGFLSIMLFILKALCVYCLASVILSTLIFALSLLLLKKARISPEESV